VGTIDVQCAATFADHFICQAAFVFTGKGQITVAGEITGLRTCPTSPSPSPEAAAASAEPRASFARSRSAPSDSRVTFALDSDND
jgi:hypothetical protein